MKYNKTTKRPEVEQDDDNTDEVDIDHSGPGIATAKKNKIMIIAASSILITAVIYFLFFKGSSQKSESLEEVQKPSASSVARSDSGKSPFEIETKEAKSSEDLELLKKPATPDIPTLPELSTDSIPSEKISIEQETPKTEAITEQQSATVEQVPAKPPTTPEKVAIENEKEKKASEKKAKNEKELEEKAKEEMEEKNRIDPRYAPMIVFSGSVDGGGPSRGVGYEKNIVSLKKNPIDDLEKTKPAVVATYIADRVNTIAQGKLLTAILETAINTELPGLVRAVVSRDVYGESGNEVLIPKGSRLFGAYSSAIVRGQGRVQVGWTRLIRADGVDLAINSNASDQFGRAGISGEIDNKYSAVITNSLLTSVLAVSGVAAAQKLLTNNSATTITTNPTQGTTTTTGSATNQAIYDVTKTIIDTVGQIITNAIDIKPIIRVPQGTKITVIVNADLKLPLLNKKR